MYLIDALGQYLFIISIHLFIIIIFTPSHDAPGAHQQQPWRRQHLLVAAPASHAATAASCSFFFHYNASRASYIW